MQIKQPREYKVVSLRECQTPDALRLCETPANAAEYWRLHIATTLHFNSECECFATLMLHAREVFRAAVIAGAAAIVLMHNHPSGDPSPSEADIRVTRDLIRAGQLLKIEVLDHVIIGQGRDVSLRELGYF